jgi:hypothetical protein
VNLKGSPHRYGVAVDPSVIRLGSKLKIWPNPFGYRGAFTAFDTGGAIKGHRLDFYDWRGRSAQMGWGVRSVSVSTFDGGGAGGGGSHGGRGGGGPHGQTFTPDKPANGKGGLRGPGYEGDLATAGVFEAQARAKDNLPGLISAMVLERKVKQRRLRRINKLLRRARGKFRTALLQEKASVDRRARRAVRLDQGVPGGPGCGHATTIGGAETLDAGIDPTTGKPSLTGTATTESRDDSAVADAIKALTAEMTRTREANDNLIRTQGPAIVNAVVAAVNGSIGGKVGLGFQGIRSAPGSVAGL